MSKRKKSSPSSYSFNGVFAVEQMHRMSTSEDIAETGNGDPFRVYWNWFVSDPDSLAFGVTLGIWLPPSEEAPEEARAAVVGRFSLETENPSPSIKVFVLEEAPKILLPYVRQLLASLTAQGPQGPIHIPLFRADELVSEGRFDAASGTQFLKENPDIAKAFGFKAVKTEGGKAGRGGSS